MTTDERVELLVKALAETAGAFRCLDKINDQLAQRVEELEQAQLSTITQLGQIVFAVKALQEAQQQGYTSPPGFNVQGFGVKEDSDG